MTLLTNLFLFLPEKMAPQAVSSTPATPLQEDKEEEEEEEEVRRRMMARRVKIIAELLQTEKDYISDLDLCIKEVIQPLRNMQVSAGVEDEGIADNIHASTSVSRRETWCWERVWSQRSGM